MEKIAAVILAAGKGTRMNEGQSSPIPKVMFKIHNRPMIEYSIENIKNAGVEKIVLVVGYKKEMVMEDIGDKVDYAVQEEQLGTGHAAMQAQKNLEGAVDAVIICYGDMPLFEPETIKNLIVKYQEQKPTIAMLSVKFDDPEFWAYGRLIRNNKGEIIGTVEQKDCTPIQLKIKDSNPGFYIFNSEWLWQNLKNLSTNNAQKEYYLTDLINIAHEQGKKIIDVPVLEESEVLGINNQEQLKKVEEILAK